MADDNEIIISIQLDGEGAQNEADKIRLRLMALAEEKKKLNEAFANGKKNTEEATMTDAEYVEELHRIEQQQRILTNDFKLLTKEQETNNNSINARLS